MVIEVMIGLSSSQIACAQSYVAIQCLKDTFFEYGFPCWTNIIGDGTPVQLDFNKLTS